MRSLAALKRCQTCQIMAYLQCCYYEHRNSSLCRNIFSSFSLFGPPESFKIINSHGYYNFHGSYFNWKILTLRLCKGNLWPKGRKTNLNLNQRNRNSSNINYVTHFWFRLVLVKLVLNQWTYEQHLKNVQQSKACCRWQMGTAVYHIIVLYLEKEFKIHFLKITFETILTFWVLKCRLSHGSLKGIHAGNLI